MRALILCFALCGVAHAETGVLIDHVPAGADPRVVMAVVRQAVVNRRWTVDATDPASITASISREIIEVKLRISLVDDSLRYDGQAKRIQPGGNPAQARGPAFQKTSLPMNWVNNLKRDISLTLATIPEH